MSPLNLHASCLGEVQLYVEIKEEVEFSIWVNAMWNKISTHKKVIQTIN